MSLTIEQHEAAPARDVGLDRRPGISHRRLNEKAARCDRAALLIRGSDRPLFDIVKHVGAIGGEARWRSALTNEPSVPRRSI